MTNEERNNILDQHKHVYDGYVTNYGQAKEQPLYVQDMANDKGGITLKNNGEVTPYTNFRVNEMRFDGKSTGLFKDGENEDYMSPGAQFDTTPTFESEEDEGYMVSVGEQLDMIGDGPDDLDHGTFGHDHEGNEIIINPETEEFEDEYDGWEGDPYEYIKNGGFMDDDEDLVFEPDSEIFNTVNDDEVEGLFDDLKESLDMFKRFTKYN
jgi:hypothetical protein